MRDPRLVLTCEHGGHRVPALVEPYFRGREKLLRSHRGHDPGALEMARTIRDRTGAPLVSATISRLVIELNRSLGHRSLFSEVMGACPDAIRKRLIQRIYEPHRKQAVRAVDRAIRSRGIAIHLGIHTFTPILRGVRRRVDIGVLFDPNRPLERAYSDALILELRKAFPEFRTLRNRPYRGTSDGLTTSFRSEFPPTRYLGIEIEVNQRFVRAGGARWANVRNGVAQAIVDSVKRFRS